MASTHPMQDRAALARGNATKLRSLAANCRLCPRNCEVQRFRGETGECGLTGELRINSPQLHHGEEPELTGSRGSGTIFYSGCNLNCLYCQNYDISQLRRGLSYTANDLGGMMLELQRRGAHNINLVTPTPQVHGTVEALAIAWEDGLQVPIVYNTGGYESVETLQLLDGLVDIYLADLKYGSDPCGEASGVSDYASVNRAALLEMQRQVGDMEVDDRGLATRGLMIRHLVLPGDRSDSKTALEWVANTLGRNTYLGLMSQYHPSWKAGRESGWDRMLKGSEFRQALQFKRDFGLTRGHDQPEPW